MGYDDDYYSRQAHLHTISALEMTLNGAAIPLVLAKLGEARSSAENIRSSGDAAREEKADTTEQRLKDRILLPPDQVAIPGVAKTVKHIYGVRKLIAEVVVDLRRRAEHHDESKLREPEISGFARFVDMPTHGTPEYDARLKEMAPVLASHYENNDHHPEHYDKGIEQMPLPALLEMLCDWKDRAGEGPLNLEYNITRYNISPQLASIIRATAEYYGWA